MQTVYNVPIGVLGSLGVGKTSLITRFLNPEMATEEFGRVRNSDLQRKSFEVDQLLFGESRDQTLIKYENNTQYKYERLNLILWDTAGEESFTSISSGYYRKVYGFMLVFDITQRPTFEKLNYWIQEMKRYARNDCQKILVGNKCDVSPKERQIENEIGKQMALQHNMHYFETSAFTGHNVTTAFSFLARQILESKTIEQTQRERPLQLLTTSKDLKITKPCCT